MVETNMQSLHTSYQRHYFMLVALHKLFVKEMENSQGSRRIFVFLVIFQEELNWVGGGNVITVVIVVVCGSRSGR